eukprot:5973366-Heterocapsa_arctica.AAC.1
MRNPEAAEFLPAHLLPVPLPTGAPQAGRGTGEADAQPEVQEAEGTGAAPGDPWADWGTDT